MDKIPDCSNDELIQCFFASLNQDPLSYKEAMESEERFDWTKAIDEDFGSIKKNEVLEFADRPINDKDSKRPNIIDSEWVLKKKFDGENDCIKTRARLVRRGYKDPNTYDLKETYAPVSRLTRLLLKTLRSWLQVSWST